MKTAYATIKGFEVMYMFEKVNSNYGNMDKAS